MSCCDDPTQPVKINRTEVTRVQQQYGDLVRDLFTSDPEKVMLKQLQGASVYLTELAAISAHYDSVKKQAILKLEKDSVSILQQIVNKQPESKLGLCAAERIEYLKTEHGLLSKFFK